MDLTGTAVHTDTQRCTTCTHIYANTYTTMHMLAYVYMGTTYKTLKYYYAHATHSKLCIEHVPFMTISISMSVMQMHIYSDSTYIYIQMHHTFIHTNIRHKVPHKDTHMDTYTLPVRI